MTSARDLMIARLAAAYRQGRLVPFLGAGMSVPACAGWEDFIIGLERQAFARKQPNRAGHNLSDELIRRANNAVRHLRLSGDHAFEHAVKVALKTKASDKTPPQTLALAKIFWPLTLTSNYDDLFYRAWNHEHTATGATLQVLGREPADCRQVLASLHSSRPPILWALQGYVGDMGGPGLRELRRASAIHNLNKDGRWTGLEGFGQHTDALRTDIKTAVGYKQAELLKQLVVGHEEYRRVAFTAAQFRRAFAEVFRSRSFLFVGSGLSEQYFLNLFGEALEIYGPSPYPHYALVKNATTDPEFLRSRLNTFVYEYGDHRELPNILDELYRTLEDRSALVRTWSYSVATSVRSRGERKASDIHVVRGRLPEPQAGECLALGVRVTRERKPVIEAHERELLKHLGCLQQVRGIEFPADRTVLRVTEQPVYLYSISAQDGQQDLRHFARAVTDLLNAVDHKEFTIVRTALPFPETREGRSLLAQLFSLLGAIANLLKQEFPLRFWLMEMIRAYGRWRRGKGGKGQLELAVHLTDHGVLFDMTTGRIDPLELLMCDDLRFTVEIEHDAHTLVSESYQCEGTVTVRELAVRMGILQARDKPRAARGWLVEVDPSPTGFPHIRSLAGSAAQTEGLDTSLSDLGVVTDCVVRFVRVTPSGESDVETKTGAATPSRKRQAAGTKKRTAKKKSSGAKAAPRKRAATQSQ